MSRRIMQSAEFKRLHDGVKSKNLNRKTEQNEIGHYQRMVRTKDGGCPDIEYEKNQPKQSGH